MLTGAQDELTNNILRPASKIGAMGGAIMAISRAFTGTGYGPVLGWAGTSVFASLIPKIIDTLFGA